MDNCGPTVSIICVSTGEVRQAQECVAVLGAASNYTYAETTLSQPLSDWQGSHVRMLEFFGGSTGIVVPDNLRSGVSRACRYDPELNLSYSSGDSTVVAVRVTGCSTMTILVREK